MNPAIFQQPFFQVTLPLMVTFVAAIWIAQWSQNKRFDDLKSDMHRRLDDIRSEIRELRAELKELRAEVKYDHGQHPPPRRAYVAGRPEMKSSDQPDAASG